MTTTAYPLVPFWSLADLCNEKSSSRGEIVELERIESATGKLIDDGVLDAEDELEDQNDEVAESTSEGKAFQAGDVLFGKLRPYLSKSWLADKKGTALGDIHVYRPNEGCDSRFLAYLVLSSGFVGLADASSSGTKMPRTEWSKIGQFKMPAPPLPTQRAIADYLDRETAEIDAMRANLDEMEQLLTERRTNAIENALKEAAKHGTIPLGYAATTVAGGTPSTSNPSYWCHDDEEGHPWVTIGDMSSTPVVTTTEKQVTKAGFDAARLTIGEPGTVLFAMYGATLGAVSRLGLAASWNQAILGVFPDESILSPDFLKLSLIASKNHLVTLHRGNTQNNLNAEQVKGLRIPLPPLAEQRRIADEIDRETAEIDSMLEDITKLRDLLVERRSAVISAAVTGEIDIPVSLDDKDEPHA